MSDTEYVHGRIAVEKAEQQETLSRLEAALPGLLKAHDKAWAKFIACPVGGKDEAQLAKAAEAASLAAWRNMDASKRVRQIMQVLDDPAEVERRIEVRQRLSTLTERKDGTIMARNTNSTSTKKSGASEAPKELVDRIVKSIEGGMGLTALAKQLTEEKVPTLGKANMWHPPVVRGIYLKATGKKGVKDIRKAHPVTGRKAADGPPKPAEKVEGKDKVEPIDVEAKGKGDDVKPDPKPTPAKKSGGKRGGGKAAAKSSAGPKALAELLP